MLSLRKQGSGNVKEKWIPAFAGMTNWVMLLLGIDRYLVESLLWESL